MANTTPFNIDGTLKRHFFRGAAGGLRTIRKQLLTWQARYATLMHLESTSAGLLGEIGIMLKVVEQLELDQAEDEKLRKAREAVLLSKGFPKKVSPFERQRKKYLDERKGKQ